MPIVSREKQKGSGERIKAWMIVLLVHPCKAGDQIPVTCFGREK